MEQGWLLAASSWLVVAGSSPTLAKNVENGALSSGLALDYKKVLKIIACEAESDTSEPDCHYLGDLPSVPFPTKLELSEWLSMRRCLLSLLVCATAIVLSGPFSCAQQDEPEVGRKVVSKVVPIYPDLARKLSLRGVVKLVVVIAPDGSVKSTEVMGGNPVLTKAAVDAVRKWRYEAAPQQTHGLVELRFDSH
jgi:TonB family protein